MGPWLPGKVSNLESPGSEPGVLPITPPGNGSGFAVFSFCFLFLAPNVDVSLRQLGQSVSEICSVTEKRNEALNACAANLPAMAMNIDREQLAAAIGAGAQDRTLIDTPQVRKAIDRTIGALDNGWLRCAEPSDNGWIVNDWVKTAIEMYFIVHNAEPSEAGPMRFYDKVPLKSMWENRTSIRIIPPAAIRFGAYLAPNTIFMPCFINIGAYVGEGTMGDTWATVGSCAQIGAGVHLSGGVGIGGVLEPPNARPVIVEDAAFIGSRCIVVEGVIVEREAVLGAGVIITASTQIIDVTGARPTI